ncbi:MAG: hypothetical protein JXB42_11005 [Deltaproteobacteria bacterium]|nr:hypothetical protein [Deltaproteobacteria bacterium]
MKKRSLLTLALIVGILMWGCNLMGSDSKDDPAPDPSEDELTQEAMDDVQTLITQSGDMDSPDEMIESMTEMDETFDQILTANPQNYLGNLGKAFTSLFDLYSNEDVMAVGEYMGSALGSSFNGDMPPLTIMPSLSISKSIELGDGTVIDESEVILNTVIPALDQAIAYMETAVSNIGSEVIVVMDPDSEEIEIDKSDLMMALAVLYGLKGELHMMVVIDTELIDPDTGEALTPDDITMMADLDEEGLLEIFMANITPSPDYEGNFLGFKNETSLPLAKAAFLDCADAFDAFYTNLMAETDDQENDLISKDNLYLPAEFFSQTEDWLAEGGVIVSISTIPDLVEFIKDVINAEVTAVVTIPTDTEEYDLHVTPGAFFDWDTNTTNAFRDFVVEFDEDMLPIFPQGFDFTLGGILASGDLDAITIETLLSSMME